MFAEKHIDPDEARLLKVAIAAETQINTEAARRNRASRMIGGLLMALVASYWTGLVVPVVWYAAFYAYEMKLSPWLVRTIIVPNRDTDRAVVARAGIAFCTAAMSTIIWTYAWIKGGPAAGILAGFGFTNTALFATSFLSNFRPGLIVAISTSMLGLIIGAYANGANWMVLIAIVLAGHTMMRMLLGVAARNRLYRLLMTSQVKQQEAERASLEKSRFLATMSHELRTPLNAVIGYAEILQEDLESRNEAQSAADATNIRRAAAHLLGVITDVLDFSKIEAGRLEVRLSSINLAALIGEAIETLRPLAAKAGNVLAADVAPGLIFVSDEAKLRQCLLNLGGNACKFTKDGRITLSARAVGDQVMIAVTDTGEGIAEQSLARIFEPFTQADESNTRAHDGTGLGLAITRRLAQLLGGDVSAASTLGQGSAFEIRLPLTPAANDAVEVDARAA
ncbi:MAG: HAMP domain-containing sensor histidine kinase [Alphaproteobacteria bacterium]